MAPGKRRVKGGVSVTMEDSHPEDTMEQQDSPKERRPSSPGGNICHLGAPQCTRCLITFADSKFQERHMKREHPADFVAQKLQGALFICFTCARSFPSSKALIIHQRSHGPAARPSSPVLLKRPGLTLSAGQKLQAAAKRQQNFKPKAGVCKLWQNQASCC
ncbi:zinc finger protein 576 isoform X3 [Urocitellus parryii]